jgi:hypothetical protein
VLGIYGPALHVGAGIRPVAVTGGAAGLVPDPVEAPDPVGLVHVTRCASLAVRSRVNAAQSAFELRPARGC